MAILLGTTAIGLLMLSSPAPASAQDVEVDVAADSASGPTVEVYSIDAATGETKLAALGRLPISIIVGLSGGYDDNSGSNRGSSRGSGGSTFARGNLSVGYAFTGLRWSGSVQGDTTFNYYSRSNDPLRPAGNLDLALRYAVLPRLSVQGTASVRYQSGRDPDISLATSAVRRTGELWQYSGSLAGTYQWLPRLSTVSTYGFVAVEYGQNTTSLFGGNANLSSHVNHSFSQSARYALFRHTNVTANYRTTYAIYDGGDSLSQSVLMGVDQVIGPHLQGSLSGGVQLFSSDRSGFGSGSSFGPRAEGNLNYSRGSLNVGLLSSYSVEESDFANSGGRQTLRIGLSTSYKIASRIATNLSGYYRNETGSGGGVSFSQEAFDISFGMSYALNRFLAASLSYQRTDFTSSRFGDYTRNRYLLGITVTF